MQISQSTAGAHARPSSGDLVWMAATQHFGPEAPAGWRRVDVIASDNTSVVTDDEPAEGYAVIFESTINTFFGYDPLPAAQLVRSHYGKPPRAVVAVVAPTLEVSAKVQHAIACQVGRAFGASVDVLTLRTAFTARVNAAPKKDRPPHTDAPIRAAVDIATGSHRGEGTVDRDVEAFVSAFTAVGRSPEHPLRFSKLQRQILAVVADGGVVPSTAQIARVLGRDRKKVSEAIAEIVDAFVHRDGVVAAQHRDSSERLHLLVSTYGLWLRLEASRSLVHL